MENEPTQTPTEITAEQLVTLAVKLLREEWDDMSWLDFQRWLQARLDNAWSM
ncbi:hypothetical protein [Streptomyces sp. URMC 129]|uniref:hypothetical protein n=1 Tax=Streptomyces sp. URMC 129 TaxID=3423407 RepID=UPI003F1CFF38